MQDQVTLCRDDTDCRAVGAYLDDRIYEFNVKATGYDDGRLLAGCVRNAAGDIIAGFNGHTWGRCCELSNVWVHDAHRGHGLGTLLLRAAETEAVARGCVRVLLATHSFQAPGLYERLGYQRQFALDGRPQGFEDIFYVKSLERSPGGVSPL
jgi:GNAT superfamily N-acetyltransferase